MSKREYEVGDRVRLIDAALKAGLRGRARTRFGMVVGTHALGDYVTVQREGIKQAEMYSTRWWEPVHAD